MSILEEDIKSTLSGSFEFVYANIDNSIKSTRRYKVATEDDIKHDINLMMSNTELDVCLDKDFWLNYFKRFINFNDKTGKFFVDFVFEPPYTNYSHKTGFGVPGFVVLLRRRPLRGNYCIDTIKLKFYVLEYHLACWLNEQINWKPTF